MKKILYTLAVALCMLTSCNDDDMSDANVVHEFLGNGEQRDKYPHPCLLLERGGEDEIRSIMAKNQVFFNIGTKVYAQADKALTLGPSEFKLEGTAKPRLLNVSRQSLQNLFSLSMAWRLSGQDKYFDGAVAELNSVCSFDNWNPSHFLDVGEMAMGVAIAYDWLYYKLPDDTKTLVENALEHLAIDNALTYNGSYTGNSNWNSVCQAGCVYAALAMYDRCPEKSQAILDKCYETNPNVLASYLPDGNYPEGYMYWAYGTGFQCMLFYGLEHLGLDVPVAEGHTHEEFFNTADYYLHMVAPSGYPFNYSDCGEIKSSFDPTMFYFAGRTGDSSLLYWEAGNALENIAEHRLLPAALIFGRDLKNFDFSELPQSNVYYGRGTTPVYVVRSAWDDPNASFMGIKGGSTTTSHAHWDNGEFIYEAQGVRWAIDLGNENYTKAEDNHADVWTLMRYSNLYHNLFYPRKGAFTHGLMSTLEEVIDTDDAKGATFALGLDPDFDVTRTALLNNDGSMTTIDCIMPVTQRGIWNWCMMTRDVTVEKKASDEVVLTHTSGKKLNIKLECDNPDYADMTFTVTDCTNPANSWETKNPGVKRLLFTSVAQVAKGKKATITARLTPIN